jgi:hypothetical protein
VVLDLLTFTNSLLICFFLLFRLLNTTYHSIHLYVCHIIPSLEPQGAQLVNQESIDLYASGLVRRSLSALVLLPVSRVAGRCALPFRSARGAEAEAPLG